MAKKPEPQKAEAEPDPVAVTSQLLAAFGAKRVIYVDDVFSASSERLHELVNGIEDKNLPKTGLLAAAQYDAPPEVVRERIRTCIDAITTRTERVALLRRLRENTEGAESEEAATATLEKILKQANVEFIPLPMSQWRERAAKEFDLALKEPTLFIFDDDFSLEGEDPEAGRKELSRLHETLLAGPHPYALLTHKVGNPDGEETLRAEIIKGHASLRHGLVVLSKTILSATPGRLPQALRAAFLSSRFEVLKGHLDSAITAANEFARKALEQLRVDAFATIVFESSELEGAWPPDTLLRIFSAVFDAEAGLALRRAKDVHVLSDAILPVARVKVDDSQVAAVKKHAIELQQREFYDDQINSVHQPVELGDVFLVGDRTWVLVGQPCDLMVRSTGLRGKDADTDESQSVVILPVDVLTSDEKKNQRRPAPEHFYLPHYSSTDGAWQKAVLSRGVMVPAWLLDLASFNAGGECALSSDIAACPPMIPAWQARCTALKTRASAVIERARAFKDLPEALETLLRLPRPYPFKVAVENAPDGKAWKLRGEIKRVRRIREPLSVGLLNRYYAYMSRQAYAHDLTRA